MKEQFVRDLKVGDRVLSFFLVKYKQLEAFRDRTRGQFLTLSLADKTGQMLARVWENAPALAEEFEESDIIKVLGEVEEYLGRLQIIIEKLRRAEADEYDLADYLPHTEKDIESLLSQVLEAIASVENPHLRALLESFFADEEFVSNFRQAPASKRIHHAYLGGLLEHVAEDIGLAQAVVEVFPQVDRSLLLAGIILHDVGKIQEFSYQRDIDYSDSGRLEGHIVLGDRMVAEKIAQIPDFPPELAMRLSHMILSHHGQYEWGAARKPQTLEACALHYTDNLGAQLNRFIGIIEGRRDETARWTEYDRLLGRYLYAGSPVEELVVEERAREDEMSEVVD
ncbi:MAG: 3'-5' exoribonuclease YhaM family protein [Anaerolineae bacterium]